MFTKKVQIIHNNNKYFETNYGNLGSPIWFEDYLTDGKIEQGVWNAFNGLPWSGL